MSQSTLQVDAVQAQLKASFCVKDKDGNSFIVVTDGKTTFQSHYLWRVVSLIKTWAHDATSICDKYNTDTSALDSSPDDSDIAIMQTAIAFIYANNVKEVVDTLFHKCKSDSYKNFGSFETHCATCVRVIAFEVMRDPRLLSTLAAGEIPATIYARFLKRFSDPSTVYRWFCVAFIVFGLIQPKIPDHSSFCKYSKMVQLQAVNNIRQLARCCDFLMPGLMHFANAACIKFKDEDLQKTAELFNLIGDKVRHDNTTTTGSQIFGMSLDMNPVAHNMQCLAGNILEAKKTGAEQECTIRICIKPDGSGGFDLMGNVHGQGVTPSSSPFRDSAQGSIYHSVDHHSHTVADSEKSPPNKRARQLDSGAQEIGDSGAERMDGTGETAAYTQAPLNAVGGYNFKTPPGADQGGSYALQLGVNGGDVGGEYHAFDASAVTLDTSPITLDASAVVIPPANYTAIPPPPKPVEQTDEEKPAETAAALGGQKEEPSVVQTREQFDRIRDCYVHYGKSKNAYKAMCDACNKIGMTPPEKDGGERYDPILKRGFKNGAFWASKGITIIPFFASFLEVWNGNATLRKENDKKLVNASKAQEKAGAKAMFDMVVGLVTKQIDLAIDQGQIVWNCKTNKFETK